MRRCAINHFADRLLARCHELNSAVCVGLDPVYDRLPASLRQGRSETEAPWSVPACEAVAAIHAFCSGVLQAVAPLAPAVKIQSACFERYLWLGVKVYHELVAEAHTLGLMVIADAKRGDIGTSSEHYAAGLLGETRFPDLGHRAGPDALTVNSYLGVDGIEPFLQVARSQGKGVFVLVRTSNPGGDALQGRGLAEGGQVSEAVAGLMAEAGHRHEMLGCRGYSLLGAVVGATKSQEVRRLRQLMPQQIFLVPGFGAQGGSADDVRHCFREDGTGALITASRSLLYAYEKPRTADWQGAIAQATQTMNQQIRAILV